MSDPVEKREHWGNRLDFILSTVGYAVGLGNIWRFPYLCFQSGGGAFLVPYFIMLVFCGVPLMIMETLVGQYTQNGPVGAMDKISPFFKGAGVGVVVMAFLFCLYYNVVISWAVYYLYVSLADIGTNALPWSRCDNAWNREATCWLNETLRGPNGSETPTEQFYNYHVLEKSTGIDAPEGFNVHMLICLAISWTLVYFILFRGIRWTGKIVYFTALFPYVILFCLLGYGVTLPGAKAGITWFFTPKWEKILEWRVWLDAAQQNFGSIGIAFGSLIAFSSYNKFHNNVIQDCLIVATVNSLTSILSGVIIFSVLGYLAKLQDVDIDDVVAQGPGLMFIVYPAVFKIMPAPHLWAVSFFFMLILLGIDSQFATLEVLITTLTDAFGQGCLKKVRREFIVLAVCLSAFVVGLPLVTKGGIYVFELLNFFTSAISLFYLAFFQTIAIVWFYGAHNLMRNAEEMIGRIFAPLKYFLLACWFVISPLLILVMCIAGWVGYNDPKVGSYEYPGWAIGVGWAIAALSIIPIPVFGIVALLRAPGSGFHKVVAAFRTRLPRYSQERVHPMQPHPLASAPQEAIYGYGGNTYEAPPQRIMPISAGHVVKAECGGSPTSHYGVPYKI